MLSFFFVLVLLSFVALSINVGRIMMTRTVLQQAADSAALAAADRLDQKPPTAPLANTTVWRKKEDYDQQSIPSTTARDIAARHWLPGAVPVSLDSNTDLRFGFWHSSDQDPSVFSGSTWMGRFEAAPSPITGFDIFPVNAVRVTTRYTLPPIFGAFLGLGSSEIRASAVALTRRSHARCVAPLALPTCRPTKLPPLDEAVLGSNGNFSCSQGFNEINVFSGVDNNPLAYGGTPPQFPNMFTFGRIDLRGDHASLGFADDLADYVRYSMVSYGQPGGTSSSCYADRYEAGPAASGLPPQPEPSLRPLVDALLNTNCANPPCCTPPNCCSLGQYRNIPIVRPANDDCTNWPTGRSPGKDMVVGFVTVNFRYIKCTDGTLLAEPSQVHSWPNAQNCETSPARVTCSQVLTPNPDGQLMVHVEMLCLPPISGEAHGVNLAERSPAPMTAQSRLVQ